MFLSSATRWSTRSLLRPLPQPSIATRTFSIHYALRTSTSTSTSTSASAIATSFLSRFQSLGPQTRTQTLDANQLQLLSLTLNRPSLFPNAPSLTNTPTSLPPDTPLPAGYHLVYFTPAFLENDLGADGTDTSYNPASPFTRRMWAGGEVHWPRGIDGKPNYLRVGQDVQETTTVLSAEPKIVRKTGEEMIVVGVEKELRNEYGVAVLDRRNWVFRKALTTPTPTPSSTPPATPAFNGPASSSTTTNGNTHTRTLRQTAVTLFRFSALTFNPHKIHYSTPWARDVEGHKDIVVHGPLNLISILDLWRDTRKGEGEDLVLPEKITYRATSPLYAEEEYRIVLDEEAGDGVGRVRIVAPGEVVAMRAEIQLKCDRIHPCTNCKKRNEGTTCTFIGRGPRGKVSNGRTSPAHVQDRLQHLENLILSFTQQQQQQKQKQRQQLEQNQEREQQRGEGGQMVGVGVGGVPQQQRTPSSNGEEEASPSGSDPAGRLVVGEEGTRYIDGAHWSAILEEISGVREYLRDNEEMGPSDEEQGDEEIVSASAPTLLLGLHRQVSREELLDGLPPRPVVDRVVALFVNSKEPTTALVHMPVFQKEYIRFWSRPKDVSIAWLGLLYACLTMAISIHQRTGEPLPLGLGDPTEVINKFRLSTAQCLVKSNYTVPGRYKVEALFLYTMGEFYRSEDAQAGVSFLLGNTIRLAMRTGYHRDPQQFPNVSPYEGEMRRRVWAILRQLDVLISFQIGLPRSIQDWQQDAEPPRNISDEEFDESTVELPPSRPESELTTMAYIRGKLRLMEVFGKVADLAYSRNPVTYDETLALDRQLEEAHDLIPPVLKMRSLDQCIVEPSYLILRRYTLELLYQKARCVLHRRHLSEVHTNPRYGFSRWVCMSASKEILRHQADVYNETQPGGLLYRDRQFPNSLQHADYLLAAMIICLELLQNPTGAGAEGVDKDVAEVRGREDLLATIETSHRIFDQQRQKSTDAQKAYAGLTIMLRRVRGQRSSEQLTSTQPPSSASWSNPYPLREIPMDITPEYHSLDVIGEMLDAPTNLDWDLWDQQIREADMGLWDDTNIPDMAV
ncbi:putative C6 transcription factor [Aspergillus ibericus CBS 121593]|uniref:C6 transcription factor n=1 Tax=Aspergillus ibericus CBS 121593 TaxID=1448316 RepID=A0A395GR66_9EURO|nr:C6 transcription factor [Aspergillus ibericus CBS 121593]RAK97862.1 C6 transcription factor [Aspergillus ibericus CBS 121593]